MNNNNTNKENNNKIIANKMKPVAHFIYHGKQVLNNSAFKLDWLNKILIVSGKVGEKTSPLIIHLAEIISVSFKQVYKSIKAGILKKRRLEEFIQSISLELELKNADQPITLIFYENRVNRLNDLPQLEKKARDWQNIFSKIHR